MVKKLSAILQVTQNSTLNTPSDTGKYYSLTLTLTLTKYYSSAFTNPTAPLGIGNNVEDFFRAIVQSCLLPHRNETHSEWLSRVRDYEKETGIAMLDVDLK